MRHASVIKQELATLGAATEMGLRADSAIADRIRALATELEAMNPTAEPARAASQLRGRWRLLYSNLDLKRQTTLAELSFKILPATPVAVVDLFNEVDPATGLWDNVITIEDDASGAPGTVVVRGQYAVDDDADIDIRFAEAMVLTESAPVRLPVDSSRLPLMHNRITYLDDGFRMVRGNFGNLYIFERLDRAPMRWSRDS
jgi:hypothetical protein